MPVDEVVADAAEAPRRDRPRRARGSRCPRRRRPRGRRSWPALTAAAAGAHDVVTEQVGDDVIAVAADILVRYRRRLPCGRCRRRRRECASPSLAISVCLVGGRPRGRGRRRCSAGRLSVRRSTDRRAGPAASGISSAVVGSAESSPRRSTTASVRSTSRMSPVSREHAGRQMAGVGIEADHLGEGAVLHFESRCRRRRAAAGSRSGRRPAAFPADL